MPDASGKFKGISVPSIPWRDGSALTDQEAKAKLVRMALAQGATVRFFEADGGRTGCVLNWSVGDRWTSYGTTRECVDDQLRWLGCLPDKGEAA